MIRRLAGALLLLAVCVPAADATVTRPNEDFWFHSPTRNIRCFFSDTRDAMTCSTVRPRQSVTLLRDGRTRRGRALVRLDGPMLRYGESWFDGQVICASDWDGTTCGNGRGGFHISSAGIERWEQVVAEAAP